MASELRDQLQSTLGSAYVLERELGGGGMSRVFVARETSLGRRVVVKVLPPDLAAGVNADRFKREIQFAAQLQHPHIVPVLSAGEHAGLPYYTMPFVEGESLRARLTRGGALSIAEAVGVLRDVAKALAHAHWHGVVHRDIKPDNVMLTGGSAVVVDFGIAKAVTASMTGADANALTTLTQVGTALGTPMYMAPEQAAADPTADHRADLYALGCLAYELLTGWPPFHGLPPQRLLAARMSERPQPVQELSAAVPPLLADLVMRCLEKDPDQRPQTAADVVRVLDTLSSVGSGGPAMRATLPEQTMFGKALAYYAVAFVAVSSLAWTAVMGMGLPDWVVPGAAGVMLLGLPPILVTGYVHRATRRALATPSTVTPGGSLIARSTLATLAVKASPHLTWRRTVLSGALALGGFALLVATFMTLRALGIGPPGSLLAKGVLKERDLVVVAEFRAQGPDTSLAAALSEAIRIALSQSGAIRVADPASLGPALRRMQQPADVRLEPALARELAQREGMAAVLEGRILPAGRTRIVTARLVSAADGDVLASFEETARADADLMPAVDRLAKRLRARIGESLRSVRRTPPLAQVTTSSLEALRKYTQAMEEVAAQNDPAKANPLLREAIALDSNFAMAYRKLGNNLYWTEDRALAQQLLRKAYDLRGRLSETERNITTGTYFSKVEFDRKRALTAFEAVLAADPDNLIALDNVAYLTRTGGDPARSEAVHRRLASRYPSVHSLSSLGVVLMQRGQIAPAESAFRAALALPTTSNQAATFITSHYFAVRLQYDSADVYARRAAEWPGADTRARTTGLILRARVAWARGRLTEAERHIREAAAIERRRGNPGGALGLELEAAWVTMWLRGDRAAAVGRLDAIRREMRRLPPLDRRVLALSGTYANAGRPDLARSVIAEHNAAVDSSDRIDLDRNPRLLGHLHEAEGRLDDAVEQFRLAGAECAVCSMPELGLAQAAAQRPDSAIATFERYLGMTAISRLTWDSWYLARVYWRLAELWEAKGERAKAAGYYAKFADLWKDADPELQPRVADARRRLARLAVTGPR